MTEELLRLTGARLQEEEGEGEEKETAPERSNPAMLTDSVRDRLFKARTLIISGEINQKLAALVMGQLLAMSSESDDPITIFVNWTSKRWVFYG